MKAVAVADPQGQKGHRFKERDITTRKVLFATDFSAACENAWPYALSLSRLYSSKVFLVHVIAPGRFASVPPELLDEAKRRARLNAENEMKRLQQLHGGTAGLDLEISIMEGDITEVLLRFEEARNVDLLVAGTRGRRNLDRLLLGSVAEKIFRQSRCPVLIVPEGVRFGHAEPVHRILYPTNFSRESSDAGSYAMSLARHFEAQLIFAHVLKDVDFKSQEKLSRDGVEALHRLHDLFPTKADFAGLHFEVAFGEPARNISRIAAEYDVDLIVVGVHPADATVAHEEERTAYRVILSALCPVLAVPKFHQGADDEQ